jgi:hypothetical protein
MKTITGLDDSIGSLTGDGAEGEIPTYRKLLQLVIVNTKARTADEARRVARIVPKLRAPALDAGLSDDEFKVLKDLTETNATQFNGWVLGQLLLRLDEVSKEK